jgi:hypothetical protein
MEDGINSPRHVGGIPGTGNQIETNANGGNRYYGFRSYNKDAAFTELNALVIPDTAGTLYAASIQGDFTYDGLQASKDYVAATARIDHKTVAVNGTHSYNSMNYSSQKGFEGVFRTVIAMNQAGVTGSNGGNPFVDGNIPMMIAGTNVRSGLPTISGFPLKDGVHNIDSRFIKVFYRNNNTFYWVTSEMVSQWYFQLIGNGNGSGVYSRMGDTDDWLTAGYGELSYALNLQVHGGNNN